MTAIYKYIYSLTAILLYIHIKYKRANIVYLSQWQSQCWTWFFLFALHLSLLAAGIRPGWLVIILGVEGVGKRMRLGEREGSDKFYVCVCVCVRERERERERCRGDTYHKTFTKKMKSTTLLLSTICCQEKQVSSPKHLVVNWDSMSKHFRWYYDNLKVALVDSVTFSAVCQN